MFPIYAIEAKTCDEYRGNLREPSGPPNHGSYSTEHDAALVAKECQGSLTGQPKILLYVTAISVTQTELKTRSKRRLESSTDRRNC